MEHTKKFYLLLSGTVLILALIFAWQVKRTINIEVKNKEVPLISENLYNVTVTEDETPRGNPGAAITVVEFFDLGSNDESVEKYNDIVQIIDKNPTSIRLFLKPAETGKLFTHTTRFAHIAAYCANQQKHYWPFIDALIKQEKRWSEESLTTAANEAKLNLDSWNRCRESDEAINAVNYSLQLANELGVKQSPTIFVNNKKIDPTTKIKLSEIIKKFID